MPLLLPAGRLPYEGVNIDTGLLEVRFAKLLYFMKFRENSDIAENQMGSLI